MFCLRFSRIRTQSPKSRTRTRRWRLRSASSCNPPNVCPSGWWWTTMTVGAPCSRRRMQRALTMFQKRPQSNSESIALVCRSAASTAVHCKWPRSAAAVAAPPSARASLCASRQVPASLCHSTCGHGAEGAELHGHVAASRRPHPLHEDGARYSYHCFTNNIVCPLCTDRCGVVLNPPPPPTFWPCCTDGAPPLTLWHVALLPVAPPKPSPCPCKPPPVSGGLHTHPPPPRSLGPLTSSEEWALDLPKSVDVLLPVHCLLPALRTPCTTGVVTGAESRVQVWVWHGVWHGVWPIGPLGVCVALGGGVMGRGPCID